MNNLRRHIMMQQASEQEYIQDGLAFWLDGIDKGATDGSWVDLMGGKTFINYGAIPISKGFSFDGVSAYMQGDFTDLFYASGRTIEVAVKRNTTDSGVIFTQYNWPQSNDSLQAYIRVSSNDFIAVASRGGGIDYVGLKLTQNLIGNNIYSFCKTHGVISKQLATLSNSAMANIGHSSLYPVIGRRFFSGSTNKAYFNGEIYSIRIYERELTLDEMFHNQQIDNERFNLGL